MSKKYCKKCGSELKEVECNYYDEYTGQKVKTFACLKVGCERHCDFFGHDYKSKYWWKIPYIAICNNCGYVPRDY